MSIEKEIERAIANGYDIEIKYVKYNGESSQRRLSNITYNNEFGDYGYNNDHIKGYCHLRNEERTFRISRINAIRILPSGLWVMNVSRPSSFSMANAYTSTDNASSVSNGGSKPSSSVSSYRPSTSYHSKPQSRNEGCYIATMAYGNYNHPQVLELRRFRDQRLLTTMHGRLFVRFYYAISPKMVNLLKGHKRINRTIRAMLDKFVEYVSK